MNTTLMGKEGVDRVATILRNAGFSVHEMPTTGTSALESPFDLLVNHFRIDVKTSSKKPSGVWEFSLCLQHIKTFVDFYIFELQQARDDGGPLYLVIPAPINRGTFRVSIRSLNNSLSKYVNNFEAIRGREVLKLSTKKDAGVSKSAYEYITPAYIKALRERLSMTQDKFSKLVGVRRETVIRWEKPNGCKPQLAYGRKLMSLDASEEC